MGDGTKEIYAQKHGISGYDWTNRQVENFHRWLKRNTWEKVIDMLHIGHYVYVAKDKIVSIVR